LGNIVNIIKQVRGIKAHVLIDEKIRITELNDKNIARYFIRQVRRYFIQKYIVNRNIKRGKISTP
jgi:hypothetical protein